MRIVLLSLAFLFTSQLSADATEPTEDMAGAQDSEVVGRFAGSYIVAYQQSEYDELTMPLSPLELLSGERDDRNNRRYEPQERIDLEGKRTRLVYLTPAGTSPLQLVRNYQQLLGTDGATVRYECKQVECGGAANRSSRGGGGHQSLSMYLWPERRITAANFSNGHCAQTENISDQRYTVLELANGAGFVSVLSYVVDADRDCSAFDGRTVAVVDVLETAQMGDSMVVLAPEEMAKSIADTGSVALYGIFFDTGKDALKTESQDTMNAIASLLDDTPTLSLLVVGHTDNVGNFESNRTLSERRAAAVVNALVKEHGIEATRLTPVGVSYAAPRASNAAEAGRAQNRRVELVEN